MAIFNSKLLVYQRVLKDLQALAPIQCPVVSVLLSKSPEAPIIDAMNMRSDKVSDM